MNKSTRLVASDVLRLADYASDAMSARSLRSLFVQTVAGDSWAVISAAGEPIALCGIYAWPGVISEAWFSVKRRHAAGCMPALCACLRAKIRAEAPKHPNGIVTRVHAGNRAGESIARYLGFKPAGLDASGQREWRLEWATR